MRFVAVDWGTTRLRAFLVEGEAVLDRAASDDGIGRLRAGEHEAAFARLCGGWLAAEPDLPVVMAGMVGSREGWVQAPYAECPAGPDEIAAALVSVEIGGGRSGLVIPGLRFEDARGADVMRGEETHLLGTGIRDGIVALPGTHCKWAELRGGRILRFASFLTGEMHALLREHSMVGRPASEPSDPTGFALGLETAAADEAEGGGGLLRLLFGARAATITGRLPADRLGPYLSGLLTGQEVAGALRLFAPDPDVTVVAEPDRAALYVEALGRRGVAVRVVDPGTTLLPGIARVLAASRGHDFRRSD